METFLAQQVSVDLLLSPYYRRNCKTKTNCKTKDVSMYDSTPLASLWGKEILKKWRCVKMYASRHDGMESSICRSRNTGVTDPVHRGFLVPVHDRFRFLSVLNSDCLFLVFFSILVSKNFTFQKYILPTKSQIVRLLQKLLGWEIFSFFLSFFSSLLFSSLLFSSLLFSLSLSFFLSFFPQVCALCFFHFVLFLGTKDFFLMSLA